jgi:hypothetical protein
MAAKAILVSDWLLSKKKCGAFHEELDDDWMKYLESSKFN